MKLTIISPYEKKIFAITWIELNTMVGNFVIQPGHVPTVLTLAAGEKITFGLANGKRESLVVKQGIAHITRDSATILLNEDVG